MQKTLIIGHLGADAVIKESNGSQFVSFSIADTIKTKDPYGTVRERTTWFDCAMKPSNVVPFLKRGTQVCVIGRISADAYIGKQDGQPKASLRCYVLELNLLGGSPQGATVAAPPQQQQAAAPQAPTAFAQAPTQDVLINDGDDDLPF